MLFNALMPAGWEEEAQPVKWHQTVYLGVQHIAQNRIYGFCLREKGCSAYSQAGNNGSNNNVNNAGRLAFTYMCGQLFWPQCWAAQRQSPSTGFEHLSPLQAIGHHHH